ncbi:hybrid sensor histidine kinase/response regulator [Carboxylicivirga sp. M1479]|uniref:hybrid sensor histidine kinase/response regulator n=1 Tax=Carboxylicivirga sp. M1479 TaxID=2594476 RepID=UPI0011780DD1|nr:hybrid sensor histidine kinase/response regulator [Carboxylicivirga sp. M1479]TRX66250.1 hybrid sensor histidine kinase/response regulator [Carboxylicivirga sp. M1479]
MMESSVRNVLIVDDIIDNVKIIESLLLKNERVNTYIATSGEQALGISRNICFDLMLIDVRMPDMDGIETLQKLKSQTPNKDVPVLFLVAKMDKDGISRVFENGGADIIYKPFHYESSLARIKVHLDSFNQKIKLKKMLEVRDRFFTVLAHDLRAPFTSILGLSEILHHRFDQLEHEDRKTQLKVLYESSNKAFELLSELLEWGANLKSVMTFNPEQQNLLAIVEECQSILKYLLNEKNISFETSVDKACVVMADQNMLKTILRNFISNAIKFSPQGSTIRVEATEKKNEVEILISDKGIGMDEDTMATIFKMDNVVSNEGTNGEIGYGFGLLICKDYIEQHQGRVWCNSTINQGSDFYFTLPQK